MCANDSDAQMGHAGWSWISLAVEAEARDVKLHPFSVWIPGRRQALP